MDITEWTIEYVKARNAMRRTLKEHTINGDEITFEHTNKTHHFLIAPRLVVPKARDWYTVVCLNTQENIEFLLNNWDSFLQDRLTVLFANPGENLSWHLNCKMHAMIADPETLDQGVRSMASEIPQV